MKVIALRVILITDFTNIYLGNRQQLLLCRYCMMLLLIERSRMQFSNDPQNPLYACNTLFLYILTPSLKRESLVSSTCDIKNALNTSNRSICKWQCFIKTSQNGHTDYYKENNVCRTQRSRYVDSQTITFGTSIGLLR